MNKKTEKIYLPIIGLNPLTFDKEINELCKDKDPQDIEKIFGCAALPAGVSQLAQGMQMQVQPLPTCLIIWKCTKEEKESFFNRQKLLLKS